VNEERKISVLRGLLERVQRRAAAPRVVPSAGAAASSAPSFSDSPSAVQPTAAPVAAPIALSIPAAQPSTSARAGSSTLPLDFESREESRLRGGAETIAAPPVDRASVTPTADRGEASAKGEAFSPGPPSASDDEADEGPPSAPRLREVPEDETAAEERDIDEEEPQLKTPPPESGRQHVTPGPAPTISEPDEDISITVTMEESDVPPSVAPAAEPTSTPMSAGSRHEIPDLSGPQPRLALVSEPEIQLHGMTPLSSVSEPVNPVKPFTETSARAAASPPLRPQDVELAVPVPSPAFSSVVSPPAIPPATPSEVRPSAQPPLAPPAPSLSRTAPSATDTRPSPTAATPSESAALSPPVRMMAQVLPDASGQPLPPVEVWASTFTPAALRGQVASFVGHNANFEPKTFDELLRASIALGQEKS
jgi:hypothetical protein